MELTNTLTEVIDWGKSYYGALDENKVTLAKKALGVLATLLTYQRKLAEIEFIAGVWLNHYDVVCWNCYTKEEVEGDPFLNFENILTKHEVEKGEQTHFCDRCRKEITA
jgi:hypothetical protein